MAEHEHPTGDGHTTGDVDETGDGHTTGDGDETGDGHTTGDGDEIGDGDETGDGHQTEHEHRMAHDGAGWRAVIGYGRHAREFWSSDVNRAVVDRAAPRDGEIALDIGAGMGAGVFVAAGRVGRSGRVLAVEPTPFMRRSLAARRRTNRFGRRVEILDGVAEDLPTSSGRVDVAWAVNVLHHITDLDRAVAELRRVLAPAGRVLLVDEDFDDPAHPEHDSMQERHGCGHHHQGGDHHHRTDDAGHHHLMVDVGELGRTMKAYGFVDISAREETIAGVPARVVVAAVPRDVSAPGYDAVNPYLTVDDTRAAIGWYERHFDATVTFDPLEMDDGRIGHAELDIGGSRIMLADEFPEMNLRGPAARGGPSVSLVVWVADADAVVGAAAADGATIERPVEEQPHGARAGWITDPFGHRWNVSTHRTDVSPLEVRRRILERLG